MSEGPNEAFLSAARYELVMIHRDQHKDVAKTVRLWGTPHWCSVCGFAPRPKKTQSGVKA